MTLGGSESFRSWADYTAHLLYVEDLQSLLS